MELRTFYLILHSLIVEQSLHKVSEDEPWNQGMEVSPTFSLLSLEIQVLGLLTLHPTTGILI